MNGIYQLLGYTMVTLFPEQQIPSWQTKQLYQELVWGWSSSKYEPSFYHNTALFQKKAIPTERPHNRLYYSVHLEANHNMGSVTGLIYTTDPHQPSDVFPWLQYSVNNWYIKIHNLSGIWIYEQTRRHHNIHEDGTQKNSLHPQCIQSLHDQIIRYKVNHVALPPASPTYITTIYPLDITFSVSLPVNT